MTEARECDLVNVKNDNYAVVAFYKFFVARFNRSTRNLITENISVTNTHHLDDFSKHTYSLESFVWAKFLYFEVIYPTNSDTNVQRHNT